MSRLTPLGHARVYRDPASGELVVDTDSIRRAGFAGADFGGYDDDDLGYEDDDDFGEDDDDFGDEDDDFGARGRGRARRQRRRSRRRQRRSERRSRRKGDDNSGWGMTAVGGNDSRTDAGAVSVRIRLQHDFKAQDVTFQGSSSGATVTSIFFGDRVVWSASEGIDASVFATNSFLRGLLKGQSLKAGLDITVNGNLTGAGDFAATLVGLKPLGD